MGEWTSVSIRYLTICETKKAPREKFEFFLKFCTEPEVEDILTIYTQENKSASVFLGAKKPKQKTDTSR